MAGRRMGIIGFLFCLCLCLIPCFAQAASVTNAVEAISPERDCSLVLSYRSDEKALSDVPVKLYKIADVSADFIYSPTSAFADTGLVLNGIQSVGEWDVIRSTLETYILANSIEETAEALTDQEGHAGFEALKPGLYLAEEVKAEECVFDSALIAMPSLGVDGLWQYDVAASPKAGAMPPVEPDEEKEYKILKLWKGDDGSSERPRSIAVEIFRNGTSYDTVILSEENHWSYCWTVKADDAAWKVVERNVPQGYTATVHERAATFILTNTLISDDLPVDSPETGDSSNILLYTVLMYASGIVLILLGITGKRKRHEDTK